jgi:hypothetical protein
MPSESGYNLYHAMGADPEALDYAQPFARVGPAVAQVQTPTLDAGAVHWFCIRPVDARGVESPLAQDEVRLELDSQGRRVADRPAGVLALAARPLPLGVVRLDWRYRPGREGVVPQVFRVFGDGGTGTINYGSALGEVPCLNSRANYTWTSGQLLSGTAQQLAVRAITAAGVWDEQPAVESITPDGAAPAAVDNLQAEVMP